MQFFKSPKFIAAVVAGLVAGLSAFWPEHSGIFTTLAGMIAGKEWFAQSGVKR